MKPIGRVCNKHGFIFGGGVCEECRNDKINLILKKRGNSVTNCHSKIWSDFCKLGRIVKNFIQNNERNSVG
jgi:hypothetical protein